MPTPGLAQAKLTQKDANTHIDYWEQEAPLPTGNHAVMRPSGVPPGGRGVLVDFNFYSVFTAGAGETMQCGLWRFRRETATGPFVGPTRLTDPFIFNSTQPGFYTIPLVSLIRSEIELVQSDMIAVARVYTAGAGDMVNFKIGWTVSPVVKPGVDTEPNGVAVWAPT